MSRTYETPIGKLDSVTTVLGIISKPYLIPWVKKEAREATIEAVWDWLQSEKWLGITDNLNQEKLREIITESVKEHERTAKKALDIGSLCHNAIECFYKEWEGTKQDFVEFIADYFPTIAGMIRSFFKALRIEKIVVLESETMVWHPYGFAGTLDCIAEVDGVLAIGDWKTSKQLSWEYYLQTEAYRRATNTMRELQIPHRFILRLNKDIEKQNKYEFVLINNEVKHQADWEAFKNCLELYKAQKKGRNK